jgi:hypothetical protein
MKRFLVICFLLIFEFGNGQTIWENNIDGSNLSNANPFTTGDVKDPNITVSGIGYGPGLTAGNFPNSYTTNGWNSNTLNFNQYFEFTITPNVGYKINFTEFIGFVSRNSSSRGPTTYELRSNLDNYASTIGVSESFPNSVVEEDFTVALGAPFQSIGTPITFRLYAYGAGFNGFSDFSVEYFKFKGSVYKVLWTNPITGTNPSATDPYTTGDSSDPNITVSGIRRGPGIIARNTANRFNASSWAVGSINGLKYFEFTLSPKAGYKINLANFVFTGVANANGPTSFALQSSIDDFDSTIGTVVAGTNTINLSDNGFQNITGTITFRLYAWNATNNLGAYGIDDFTFNGAVVSTTSAVQTIWTNSITATNPSAANPFTAGDVKDANITVSGIGRGTGIVARTTADRYDATGWNSTNINGQDYFEFTLTPNSGYKINLSSFVFDGQTAGATAPTEFALQSSIDGFTSQINVVEDLNTIDLTNAIFQNLAAPITFRLYAWGASGANGRYGVNSFAFNGSVVVDSTPVETIWSNPIIDANPSASNPFTNGDVKNANITVSGIGRGSGVVPRTTANRYDATGWNSAAIDTQDYYEFILTPNSGYAINFNSFVFDGQSASSSAPDNFALRSSVDNFGSDIGIVADDSNIMDLTNGAYQNVTGSITFRIYAWGGSDATGRYGINQFFFKGAVVPCASPTITTTGAAIPVCFNASSQSTNLFYSATTGSPNSYSIDWDATANTAGLNDVMSTSFAFASSGGNLSIAIPAGLIPNIYAGSLIISTGGCSATQAITMTIKGNPDAPVLNNIVLGCNQTVANGTWSAVPNISDYRFDLSLDPAFATFVVGYQDITVAPTANPTVTVNGLSPGVTYYARARAVDNCGTSVNSNAAIISVPITKTADGGLNWDNGIPDSDTKAVFTGSATMASSVIACSCQIDPNVDLVVGVPGGFNDTAILKIENGLIVDASSTLTFENNASLVQVNDEAENSGVIVYKRTSTPMKNFDYTYWSSPVAGQTAKDLSPNTLADKYFRYDNNLNDWVFDDGVMLPGVGYIIRTPKDNGGVSWPNGELVSFPYPQPVEFTGVPNNKIASLPIGPAGNTNLIGNPYPSALSADAFLLENSITNPRLEGTIYLWTHNTVITNNEYSDNDFASYNYLGGVGTQAAPSGSSGGINNTIPSGNIAAGQSFVVNSLDNSQNVVFKNNMRVDLAGKNAQFFKGTKTKQLPIIKHRVWLNLSNKNGVFKQILVGYATGATNGIDNAFDGKSIDSNEYADFFSINENTNFVIQGRALPFVPTDTVPLGYKTASAGVFAVSIDQSDGILNILPIFLEDKVAKVIYNLKKGPYSFETAAGTFNDRFVLRFTDKKEVLVPSILIDGVPKEHPFVNDLNTVLDETGNKLLISVKDKQIKINSFDQKMDIVMVYDLKGKLIYKKNSVNSNEFNIQELNSSNQILIVITQMNTGNWIAKEVVF